MTTASMISLGDRAFLNYYNFNVGQQILLWIDADGTIAHEDTLDAPLVHKIYAGDNLVRLVAEHADFTAHTSTYIVYSYDFEGEFASADTIYVQQLATSVHGLVPAIDAENGILTIITGTLTLPLTPSRYRLRLTRFDGQENVTFPEWDPGPIPNNVNLFPMAFSLAPFGNGILAYGLNGPAERNLFFIAVSAEGVPGSEFHTTALPDNIVLNAVVVDVFESSVYSAFTYNDPSGGGETGAFLSAFPVNEILSADDRPAPLPDRLQLSAYPNPFNSEVRIDYTAPFSAGVTLSIYDLLGRFVANHTSRYAGDGRWFWSPAGLAAGNYIVEMRSGDARISRRLLYLK